jgi:DNA-binding LacI/PurR family transcriptional regulator
MSAPPSTRAAMPGRPSVCASSAHAFFDGVPAAERAQLTTIRQPTLDKGRAAGELLLDRGDRQRSRTLLLPTDLLVRGTSGPARTGALR